MKPHRNAKLSVKGRELLVYRVQNAGWSLTEADEAAGVSDRTARKWLARSRTEGPDGLFDRSSAPSTVANRTDERRIEVIASLLRLRMTGAEIAETLGMAVSTVSGILTRIGLGKLGRISLFATSRGVASWLLLTQDALVLDGDRGPSDGVELIGCSMDRLLGGRAGWSYVPLPKGGSMSAVQSISLLRPGDRTRPSGLPFVLTGRLLREPSGSDGLAGRGRGMRLG